ncbi:quinolinate synthase NadA [Candidatus Thorarchaeota archaeon]|nr:MAG: quinolinate synthase NadA [Candidatus Thorarchaeota archaeon]
MDDELSVLQNKVLELKKKRNALILAHNYQTMDIQEIADFVGDSLQLAQTSAEVQGYDMIVFAGVRFMAEMAAILAKNTPVYIPETEVLCPLAAFVDAEVVCKKKKEYPGVPVIVYVNTTAETKSEADMICTSGSAAEVVEAANCPRVIFGPDSNLADFVRKSTDVEIIDLEPSGHCYVHQRFTVEQIEKLKKQYPNAIAIAHPECPDEVQEAADLVGSTGMMVKTVAESEADTFLIATEMGLVHQLQKNNPEKTIIPVSEDAICFTMKRNTLKGIYNLLKNLPEENRVTVPEHMVQHIKNILDEMNRVKGNGKAAKVTTKATTS